MQSEGSFRFKILKLAKDFVSVNPDNCGPG